MFSTESLTTHPISPLNFPCSSCSICPYNSSHILKFGGTIYQGDLCQTIELYSLKSDLWTVLNPKIQFR
jgi:hypothetical protein